MSASEEDEEIEKFREMFACFDADGSGKIDVTELSIGLRDKGMNRNRASIIKLIDDVDTDNDQELDFDEFLNLVQSEKLASLFSSEEKQELERQQSTVGLNNIYGQTPTPTETEESVKTGLGQLQAEIDAIGDDQKKGFNQALEKCPHLIDDDFLLMFLRTEVFHAERAAKRLMKYWKSRIEVFGEEKAFVRLTLDDALADDSVALSLGYLQPTGQSDTTGRAIVFMDVSQEGKADYTKFSLIRTVWYAIHVALEDKKAQKEGVVFLIKTVDNLRQWDIKNSMKLADHMKGALPFRLGCFHLCHSLPIVKSIVKVTKFILGKLRSRIRVHQGTHEEVIDSLATYGIPKSAVPSIWGGEFNIEAQSEWQEARRLIESRN